MGDRQNRPVLGLLLEALVAGALIGTFVLYGYPTINTGPITTEPGDRTNDATLDLAARTFRTAALPAPQTHFLEIAQILQRFSPNSRRISQATGTAFARRTLE